MKVEKIILRRESFLGEKIRGTSVIIGDYSGNKIEVHVDDFFKFLDQDFSYLEKYKASDND